MANAFVTRQDGGFPLERFFAANNRYQYTLCWSDETYENANVLRDREAFMAQEFLDLRADVGDFTVSTCGLGTDGVAYSASVTSGDPTATRDPDSIGMLIHTSTSATGASWLTSHSATTNGTGDELTFNVPGVIETNFDWTLRPNQFRYGVGLYSSGTSYSYVVNASDIDVTVTGITPLLPTSTVITIVPAGFELAIINEWTGGFIPPGTPADVDIQMKSGPFPTIAY